MSSRYLSSIQEVRQWLSFKGLSDQIYSLVDQGFDDLDSIARCSPADSTHLISIFSPDLRPNAQLLLDSLCQLGPELYRKQKGEFRRLIAAANENSNSLQLSTPSASKSDDPKLTAAINQTESYLVQARSQLIPKTGYCAVRASAAAPWSDKYVSLEGTDLKWFTSRRDVAPEIVFPLSLALTSVDKSDAVTCILQLANNTQIELGFDNPNETDEWFAAFASVIPVAQASLLLAQQQSAVSSSSPSSNFDSSTVEGSISLHAHYRVRLIYHRSIQDPLAADELTRTILSPHSSSAHFNSVLSSINLLVAGSQFKKFKRGSANKRLIWCDSMLQAIIWGSEDKKEIKGFLRSQEIREVKRGSGKDENRLTIATSGRTLELECRDANHSNEWLQLVQFLMQCAAAEVQQKKSIFQQFSLDGAVQRVAMEYSHLLITGENFKKWPAIKSRGSSTQRKVAASSNIDRLNWCDANSGKILGFLPIQDIVEIQENPSEPLKFTVAGQKRALVLEAPSAAVRDKWVRAIRFFVEFKLKQ